MSNHEESPLYNQRHSLAHILAQAVQRSMDPSVKLGIGPAIDNGFYYDFIFTEELTEENLKSLSKFMQKIVKEGQPFIRVEVDYNKAKEIIEMMGEDFKIELLDGFKAEGETVFSFYINTISAAATNHLLADAHEAYKTKYNNLTSYLSDKCGYADILAGQFVTFIDMCEGPHVENTKEVLVDAFVLDKIAGAYWRGDSERPMMSRIYGISFESKDELKAYQTMMEEAKKRDHRILWAKLKIFTISDLVGSGLPLFQPNGAMIRKELEDYLWALHKDRGYDRVWSPHLAKEDLYKVSGHAGHYLDDMFKVHGGTSNEDFYVKPMNCPHHTQIFADNQFSYRDMPVRYFEPATVYRDEKTGQLSGLARVRSITQDDGHLFCRVGQIHEEVSTIVHIIKEFYTTMNMLEGYRVRLSLRGDDKEHYLGGDEVWEKAEGALTKVCDDEQLPYKAVKGEAAFYGPKLDFMFKDAIGREWQLATCQLDFNLPQRFQLSYINEQGEKEQPIMIHRAIGWSIERFMSVMIEHFGGAFPLWLAPVQMQIVPVADPFNDYAFDLRSQLNKAGFRVRVDDSADSFSKKIRNAELMKVPYILIVGEKEQSDKTISVRVYKTKEQLVLSIDDFIAEKKEEYRTRAL